MEDASDKLTKNLKENTVYTNVKCCPSSIKINSQRAQKIVNDFLLSRALNIKIQLLSSLKMVAINLAKKPCSTNIDHFYGQNSTNSRFSFHDWHGLKREREREKRKQRLNKLDLVKVTMAKKKKKKSQWSRNTSLVAVNFDIHNMSLVRTNSFVHPGDTFWLTWLTAFQQATWLDNKLVRGQQLVSF